MIEFRHDVKFAVKKGISRDLLPIAQASAVMAAAMKFRVLTKAKDHKGKRFGKYVTRRRKRKMPKSWSEGTPEQAAANQRRWIRLTKSPTFAGHWVPHGLPQASALILVKGKTANGYRDRATWQKAVYGSTRKIWSRSGEMWRSLEAKMLSPGRTSIRFTKSTKLKGGKRVKNRAKAFYIFRRFGHHILKPSKREIELLESTLTASVPARILERSAVDEQIVGMLGPLKRKAQRLGMPGLTNKIVGIMNATVTTMEAQNYMQKIVRTRAGFYR